MVEIILNNIKDIEPTDKYKLQNISHHYKNYILGIIKKISR